MHTASSFYPLPEGNKSSFHFSFTAKKIKEEGFEGLEALLETHREMFIMNLPLSLSKNQTET